MLHHKKPKALNLVFCLITILIMLSGIDNSVFGDEHMLQTGFYSKTCPSAETIVNSVVKQAVANNPGTAAMLLRLQFHDCFVEGCDGSILLNGTNMERDAFGNQGVGGYTVIQDAKTAVEKVCPRVVSCADIVVIAARDAVRLTQGPFYQVQTGRRDGTISEISLAANLPDVEDPIDVLKAKFMEKGLSDRDFVLLSGGAHTIGLAACFFMEHRLYNFTPGGGSDPSINPRLLPMLQRRCPFQGDTGVRIPLDWGGELVFDDRILHNIYRGFGVIGSDARLNDDKNTRQILTSYVKSQNSTFAQDFAVAMVKMGAIGVKTGSEGQIRRICNSVN